MNAEKGPERLPATEVDSWATYFDQLADDHPNDGYATRYRALANHLRADLCAPEETKPVKGVSVTANVGASTRYTSPAPRAPEGDVGEAHARNMMALHHGEGPLAPDVGEALEAGSFRHTRLRFDALEALNIYFDHKATCAYAYHGGDKCDCGCFDALAIVRRALLASEAREPEMMDRIQWVRDFLALARPDGYMIPAEGADPGIFMAYEGGRSEAEIHAYEGDEIRGYYLAPEPTTEEA